MDITRFTVDGRLAPDALNREFLKDKLFAMELVQALTVLDLQELKQTHGVELATAGRSLPPQLRANLANVLTYVTDPTGNYREP